MNGLQTFATQVHKMRLAQQRYFELAKKPRPTRTPEDFKAIKDALEISKRLEADVDEQIEQISNT